MVRNLKRIAQLILLLVIAVPVAEAQLGLPTLPTLPNPALPAPAGTVTRPLGNTVNRATNELNAQLNNQGRSLRRATQVRQLLRAHRDVLEVDPDGALILRSQIVAISPTPAALQAAQAAGFTVIEQQPLPELDIQVVILQSPTGLSIRRALQRLRALDANGSYDYNHVYVQTGSVESPRSSNAARPRDQNQNTMRVGLGVGLIDSGVEVTHSVFTNNTIHSWGCEPVIATAHGTAVASLLVGQHASFVGAAPHATLYAADVYCGQPVGGSMTRIAAALTWMAEQQVPVINISLVGPDNLLLKQLVRNLIARGHVIVAAVGNEGPAAPPLYPAAYPDVVGVTAVDARGRVLVEAGRGVQVDFAAPGTDMAAATLQNAYANVRGTSFAAPLVAGLLAMHIQAPQPQAVAQALQLLAASARRTSSHADKIYGQGIVAEQLRVSLASMSVKSDKTVADR